MRPGGSAARRLGRAVGPGTFRARVRRVQSQRPLQIGWQRGEDIEHIITREWLVTNGIGGYASGTIGGACTRRFHGLLIAALPAPLARSMMFNHLEESIRFSDGKTWSLSADEIAGGRAIDYPEADFLE